MNQKKYTIHLVGFRSSERMVLQSFLTRLERQHDVSFDLLSIVNEGRRVDLALVNMHNIQQQPAVDAALTAYNNSITPCVLVYDRGETPHPEHQRPECRVVFRPMNFSQVAETIWRSLQTRNSEIRQMTAAGYRVLVVDDSASVRADICHKLADADVQLETASNAEQALQMYVQHDYDLIFMDVLMPGNKDGYDACLEIKNRCPALPVVLLTARDSILSKVRGRMAKCDQYIIKPASRAQLQHVLAKHLFSHTPMTGNGALINATAFAAS